MFGANDYPSFGIDLNVTHPIGVGAKAICDHDLGAILAILDDFQNCFAQETGAASDVSQEHYAVAEEWTKTQVVEVNRGTEEPMQRTVFCIHGARSSGMGLGAHAYLCVSNSWMQDGSPTSPKSREKWGALVGHGDGEILLARRDPHSSQKRA